MLQCLLRTISHRYLVRAKYTRINSGRAKAIARPLIIGDIHLNAAASDQTVRLQHTRSKFLQAFLAQPPIPSSRYKPAVSMASDEVYSDFLDKANQDTGTSKTSTQSTSKLSTKAVDTDIPGPLQKVEQYYTSEADEPFEPVSLKWNGSNMPSENDFGELIGHKAKVSTVQVQEFDPRGNYKEVLETVEKIADGKSTIFKVEHGRTMVEYYVVGLDEPGKKIVGLKAMAVET